MATTLPTCEALRSPGTAVTTMCGRTREVTGVEPAPRPGREGAGGALRRQHQIGRWLGRARGAGKAKPRAPGKRNLSPKPGGEGSVGGATPTPPSRPDSRNDPPGHRPVLHRSRASRGPGAPSTCVLGCPGGKVPVPERPGASAFMGTRRGRAGGGPPGGAAGAAEEVTCSGCRFPCVLGEGRVPQAPRSGSWVPAGVVQGWQEWPVLWGPVTPLPQGAPPAHAGSGQGATGN